MREIGEKVGLASPSTVHAHLANLERAGLIKRDPTKPRALELTGRTDRAHAAGGETHALPLLGQIAAGGPLLAEQNVDAYMSVPEPLSRGGEEFLLRVRGDSMQNAGILEGDYVVVRRQQDARNGDIVVALVGEDESADEATVKRFFRDSGSVRLQPENDALPADRRRPRRDPRQGDGSVPLAVMVESLHRSLDQELVAILRRVSLECPVCGEFLLHRADGIGCPQCGLELQGEAPAAMQLTDVRLTDAPAL